MSDRGSILIVDDELGPRESLRFILKPHYETFTAGSGQEALQLLQERDFDLVTLDLNMPGLPGLDVLKAIRDLKPEAEVVIITGYGSLPNAQEAIRHGAGNFISKPFDAAEIVTIVAKCFERKSYESRIKAIIQKMNALGTPGSSMEDYSDSLLQKMEQEGKGQNDSERL
jgi:putative two-component system response regulator